MTAGYRSDGQRAWKQNSGGTTYYFYDGDRLLYETNSVGTITAKNTWGDTGLLARSTAARTLLYSWDVQGNVCQQLDASTGNVVASYMFDAFGTRGTNGNDTAAMAEPYAGFGGNAGYYTDSETGLQLCGHRYLDPSTGRFLTRDPISYAGGINLYECVGNSPLGGHDESGLKWNWGEGGKGGLGGAIGGAFECAGTWYKQWLLHKSGEPSCESQEQCQQKWNCILDIAFGTLCAAIVTGLLEGCEPCAGCICGAIEGGLHYAVDYFCSQNSPCLAKKYDGFCLALSIEMGAVSGCIGGLIGGEGASGAKQIINKLLSGLVGTFGGGTLDAAADKACEENQ